MRTDDAVTAGTSGSARPGRRPRGSLNQRVILDAAFALTKRGGLDAVTFQALGAELGAHPTAVYRHFRDKDELLLAMIDALHAETLAELPAPTGDWAADLAAIAQRTHAVFLRHPAVAAHAYRTARREHEFRIVERIIGCLRGAGFDDRDAARLYRVFGDFVLGYSALDAGLASLEPATRREDLLSWEVHYRTLPAGEYPNIAGVAHALPALDDPENFTTAVELMIEAIRARAATARSATASAATDSAATASAATGRAATDSAATARDQGSASPPGPSGPARSDSPG